MKAGNPMQHTQRLALSLAGLLLSISLTGQLAAMAAPPEAIRNYNQGIEAYNQGRASEALQKFAKAVQIDPSYSDAYYNMGSIYYQMKHYEEAREMFQRAANLNPNDNQIKYNLALALEKLLRYEDATRLLQEIPASDPKFGQARAKLEELKSTIKPQVAATPTLPAQPSPAKPATGPLKPVLQTFSKGYDGPTGLTIGPGGFMYVANYSKNLIYRVGAGGEKTVFTQDPNIKGPIGLVFNPKENELYVANYLQGNIVRVNPTGQASVLVSGLNKPYNLYLDSINNILYVSEQENNIISRVVLP